MLNYVPIAQCTPQGLESFLNSSFLPCLRETEHINVSGDLLQVKLKGSHKSYKDDALTSFVVLSISKLHGILRAGGTLLLEKTLPPSFLKVLDNFSVLNNSSINLFVYRSDCRSF